MTKFQKYMLYAWLIIMPIIYLLYSYSESKVENKTDTKCTCPCYSTIYVSHPIVKDGKWVDVGENRRFLRDHCK